MLLKDIRYGVQLEISGLTLAPFRSNPQIEFEYHLGNIDIKDYLPSSLCGTSIPSQIDDVTHCWTSYMYVIMDCSHWRDMKSKHLKNVNVKNRRIC
jgi:hypothetical protein